MNKTLLYIGASLGGIFGGILGSRFDGSSVGVWSVLLSAIGGIVGIAAAYKIQQ